MNDNYVSKATVVAWALWGKAVLMVLVVWLLAALHIDGGLMVAVALTAVFSTAVAATWQVRVFSMRLCALVRVSAGLQSPDAELHRLDRP